MKKRMLVRILSFSAAAVLATLGFLIRSEQKADRYRLQIETTYSHMLDSLNESAQTISVLLQKAAYTTSAAQLSGLSAQLLGEAQTAKAALSGLPTGGGELPTLNRFFSQVGYYAVSVSQKAAEGDMPGEQYDADMMKLSAVAHTVSEAIGTSAALYNNPAEWARALEHKLGDKIDPDSFAGAAVELEESLEDYPTLVYDGPYSDHLLEKEPQLLKDKPEVSEKSALKSAAAAAQCDAGDLQPDGEIGGKIPAYRFSGNGVTVSVSKQGGYPVMLRKTRTVQSDKIEETLRIEAARQYLQAVGLTDFQPTYSFTDEGVCVINFAFTEKDTVCYTDLVKVGVATDNGEIMLLETAGYLTNHTSRTFPQPKVSEATAAKAVHKSLQITKTSLALIPTEGGGEVHCYEFLCRTKEEKEILVYVDTATGTETDILILLKSDGGTLTR